MVLEAGLVVGDESSYAKGNGEIEAQLVGKGELSVSLI